MLAALLALATAAPSPSPSAQPLQTIVTVRTSPFCGAFATHVNSAISSAVNNDKSLGTVIFMLRARGLSSSSIERNNEILRLENAADSMYRAYRAGEREVDHLRDLAKTAKDKSEQEDIKSSADALGGVLYRQHLIQRDLDGFVAYLQAGDLRRDSDAEATQNEALFGAPDAHYAASHPSLVDGHDYWLPTDVGAGMQANSSLPLAGEESLGQDQSYARAASRDFERRVPGILKDELRAGARIARANERC